MARLAVLTGEGVGAVAVVRVWGDRAVAVVDSAFRPRVGAALRDTPPGRPRLGHLGAGTGDEVVAIVMADDAVEVQCHGGAAAIALVVEALERAGAIRSPASAWVRHSAGSRIQAEAMLDLPHAPTLRAAAHLLDQAGGALDRELAAIGIDPPEAAIARLDVLLARAPVGLRLVSGWKVVLAGRPNVGKSRLLNALVGFERAIVAPTPGTTRDVVASTTAFDGWPVELADTAGLRTTDDPIEAAGVARARDSHRRADLVVLVLDLSVPMTDEDRQLLRDHPAALVVANKADLPPAWDFDGPSVSAERGDRIAPLADAIARRLVPDPPPAGSALPFRPRQVRRLELIRSAFQRGDRQRAVRSLLRWNSRRPGLDPALAP